MKADLTSADLADIRLSVLGAADPLGIASDLAHAAGSGGFADPGDAAPALTLAAEIAESRSKLDAALTYVDQAVAAFAGRDDSPAAAAHALRARILFRAGRDDEALAELEPLRPLILQYPDAAAYISAALVAGGRAREAEQWLTAAVQESLAQRGGTEPADSADAGLLFFLLQQRHRLRHVLGLQHDAHDNLAERLEAKLAGTVARAESAVAGDPLFWPRAEFDALAKRWPELAESYGPDWDEHRARIERDMSLKSGAGLHVLPASVAGLAAYAGADGDPAARPVRDAYARTLTAAAINWPPERNAACWCGSGAKYKKCCLPRARS
ncbi:hypothetical protein Acsp01_68720 [Actinoplanes sp. NBRC 101535]|nr:hypothetical protein Acsp01_68720 [Actinoplanes sp. NBRC 101535]